MEFMPERLKLTYIPKKGDYYYEMDAVRSPSREIVEAAGKIWLDGYFLICPSCNKAVLLRDVEIKGGKLYSKYPSRCPFCGWTVVIEKNEVKDYIPY